MLEKNFAHDAPTESSRLDSSTHSLNQLLAPELACRANPKELRVIQDFFGIQDFFSGAKDLALWEQLLRDKALASRGIGSLIFQKTTTSLRLWRGGGGGWVLGPRRYRKGKGKTSILHRSPRTTFKWSFWWRKGWWGRENAAYRTCYKVPGETVFHYRMGGGYAESFAFQGSSSWS